MSFVTVNRSGLDSRQAGTQPWQWLSRQSEIYYKSAVGQQLGLRVLAITTNRENYDVFLDSDTLAWISSPREAHWAQDEIKHIFFRGINTGGESYSYQENVPENFPLTVDLISTENARAQTPAVLP